MCLEEIFRMQIYIKIPNYKPVEIKKSLFFRGKIIKIINKRIIIASYLRKFHKRYNLKNKFRKNFGSFIYISYFCTDICKSPNSFGLLGQ